MSEKQRALPVWMGKKNVKVKEKAPLKTQRKRKAARVAFYCMNEAELVEAAVSYLTSSASGDGAFPSHQQAEEKAKDSTKNEDPVSSKMTARPENFEECDDLETTCVSETDLDVAEMETLPFTKSPQHPGCEPQRSGAARDGCGPVNIDVKAETRKGQLHMSRGATEEDDALRLVREIFFT
ncbi:uncharacterized protein PAE49_007512 [Odontesthes bonariensis]|uniref:uncharacterized protein LOC142383888 n=1 Tax=Odontesthes bonariensis TaxID=219752 RepID=UPI003F588FB5